MTHKKYLIAAFAATVAAVGAVSAVQAHQGPEDHAHGVQQFKIDERKAKLRERLETVKAERTAKLADKRLEACEKREAKVNQIFTKATAQNEKQLAVIQKIEDKVKAFYVDKKLTTEAYDLAVAAADAAEAEALAAISTSKELTFECETTDAIKPGSIIKAAMIERHTALMNYRTAVKDLILAVKKHNGQNRNADAGTPGSTENESGAEAETEPRTETDTETSTGGGQ